MSEIPRTMRAAVLHEPHRVQVEQRPVPVPGPGEVLVRVHAVGLCGSDVHYYEHGRIGDHVVREPLVLGHEASGSVVAVGDGVPGHRVGQRVSLEPGVPCRTCRECLGGRYNLCPQMRFFATPPVDGAFCEFVLLHEAFAHPVPDSLSDEVAALLEPLSVGVWACWKGRVGTGCRVLVTGAGPVGLVALQTARALGAAEVVVCDVNPARLDLARDLGASAVVDVGSRALDDTGLAVDVLLECSGSPRAAAEGTLRVGRAGRAVLVGMGGDDVPLPLAHIQQHEVQVTGTFRYANTWPTAIALAQGAVRLDRLVTHRFALDDVDQALTAPARDPGVVKAVVLPQEHQ
jgi:L-iditol 2-dehydrogenase